MMGCMGEAFAFQSNGDSGLVSLIPTDPATLAVDGGDPAENLHVTIAYLGKLDRGHGDGLFDAAEAAADAIAAQVAPFTAMVTAVGELCNDEPPAMVLFLDAPGAAQARRLFESGVDGTLTPDACTYPDYKPHLTLGYGLNPADYEHLVGTSFDLGTVALAGGPRHQ